MRDLLKILLAGIVIFFAPQVFAETYKVLVIPDNIVTENAALDSYIYDASAEFFADEVVTILNGTDFIKAPYVSDTRALFKKDASSVMAAKNMTSRFRSSYNVDYSALKKLAYKANSRYVLLITSFIDSENYILRRTVWDFLNIPGASVVDPAYKISTYAVLVDTKNGAKLWADTYYKTISVCENRIITRGASPQTEQLEKIKDYSRYLCPQIAQNVQIKVLPANIYAKESNQVQYDIGNIDNVFTKKYRHLGKEYDKVYIQKKAEYEILRDDTKAKIQKANEERKLRAAERKEAKQKAKLEVKATPVYSKPQKSGVSEANGVNKEAAPNVTGISDKVKSQAGNIKKAVFKKKAAPESVKQNLNNVNYFDNSDVLDSIDLKRNRKNNLYGNYDSDRPELRDYN